MLNPPLPTRENLKTDTIPLISVGRGGLNLSQSVLQMPEQDLTVARNVVVDNDGVIRRRQGTHLRGTIATQTLNGATNRCNSTVITTPFGHDFAVFRMGRTIHARNITATRLGSLINVHSTGPTVLSNPAGSQPGDMTVLRDPRLRILLTVGGVPPLDIHVTEVRVSGNGTTTVQVSRDELIPTNGFLLQDQSITASQLAVMVNGVSVPVTSMTSNSTTITITLASAPGVGFDVDVVLFRSYWVAEATQYYADRFCDTLVRTDTDDKDIHVSLPTNLRDDLGQRGASPTQYSPVTMDLRYWGGSSYLNYSQVSNGLPSTFAQWASSNGAPRADNNPVVPSNLAITFGAWTGGSPRPIYAWRQRKLNHNGGRGGSGAQLEVVLDAQRLIFSGSTTGNAGVPFAYRLWDSSASAQVTNFNTVGSYISLDANWSTTGPWSPNSLARVISFTNPKAPSGMSRVPLYGMPDIADYHNHSYPTTSATYNQRLVLAGMPHDPLLVAFSAVYDSRTPDEPYMYFQEDPLDQGGDTKPFKLRLDSTPDDVIVALEEHQGSLFVITKRAVFRVAPTGRGNFSAESYYVSRVASVGCPSNQCVSRPEGALSLLTEHGLYLVDNGTQANEFTEYKLTELSTKIRPVFDRIRRTGSDTRLWWSSYDPVQSHIYIGVSEPGDIYWSSSCYIYNLSTQTWSQWDTISGAHIYHGFSGQVGQGIQTHYLLMDPYVNGGFSVVETGAAHHADYLVDLGTTDTVTYTAARPPLTQTSTLYNNVPGQGIASGKVYPVIHPFSPGNVTDLEVTLGGDVLGPDDWTKFPNNYIALNTEPDSSKSLQVKYLTAPGNDHHVVLVVAGMATSNLPFYKTPGTTDTVHSASRRILLADPYPLQVGMEFQSVVATPCFTFGSIATEKRIQAITLYNERYPTLDRWYGTRRTRTLVDGAWWPTLEADEAAATEWSVTDVPVYRHDAHVSVLTDQQRAHPHPITILNQRDFYDTQEGTNITNLTRPEELQVPLGASVRRTFVETVTVVQVVVTSTGSASFGVSGLQLEASSHPSKTISRTR